MSEYNWQKINEAGEYDIPKLLSISGDYKSWLNLVPRIENNWLINFDLLEKTFPQWINAMKNCPQDSEYHAEGDVWTHTKMVLIELVSNSMYKNLSIEDQEIMFFTVLMHDIGKPYVSKIDEDTGKITSKGHSARGAKDARLTLFFAKAPMEIREKIANIISVHQKPFTWVKKASIFDLRKTSQYVPLNLLYLMALSDGNGRTTLEKEKIIEKVELFKIEAEFQNCFNQPWNYPFTCSHAKMLYWEGNGDTHESRPVFWEDYSDVIILSGLPASGKDTWCNIYAKDKPIISLDSIREELGVKYKDNMGYAIQVMLKRAKDLLGKKENFVWNATHLSDSQRNKTLRLLREYGAKTRWVYLEANPDELLKRNLDRDTTLSNKRLMDLIYKWQPPLPFEGHEVIVWNENKPNYIPYITSEKDRDSPWLFDKKKIFKI